MIIYNKNPVVKDNICISLPLPKRIRRAIVVKRNKITKENKQSLQYLGFKLQNAANHRSTKS